jgi:vacuolar protein-sorting-associated protein 4
MVVQVEDDGKHMLTPCGKGDAGAVAMTWRDVPKSMLKAPDVVREDIFSVLENVKPSVMNEELTKYEDWTEQFGSEGA